MRFAPVPPGKRRGRRQIATVGLTMVESRRVTVRLARGEADIDALTPLFAEYHRESRYRDLQPDMETRRKFIREHFLEKPKRYGLLIAEYGGEPAGLLSCMLAPILYYRANAAVSLSFYVPPRFRGGVVGGRVALSLVRAFRQWGKNRKALELQMHLSGGIDVARTDAFMSRLGFHRTGGNFSMDLSGKS